MANLRVASRLAAPDQRPYPRFQFSQGNRFDDVVVGTQIKACYPILHCVARSQDQHRERLPSSPQLAQHFSAVQFRQAKVENSQVVLLVR